MSLVDDFDGAVPILQIVKIFADYDNYPIGRGSWMLPLRIPIVHLTNAVGKIATLIGYQSQYKEYTPPRLMNLGHS